MAVHPPMHCLSCDYDLRGVAAGPCPECGRLFDPADPATHGTARSARWRKVPRALWWPALIACPGPLWHAAGLGAIYMLAWWTLGREPEISGRDDPKSLWPLVAPINTLISLALLFSPLLTFGAAAVAAAMIGQGTKVRRSACVIGIAIAAWPLSFVLWLMYPGKVWTWWID